MLVLTFNGIRPRPKPADGHRNVWQTKHQNYAAFLKAIRFATGSMWSGDPIQGHAKVHTAFIVADHTHGDANNLHAGMVDALQGICYGNDKCVIKGSYELEVQKGVYQIRCQITDLRSSGKGASSSRGRSVASRRRAASAGRKSIARRRRTPAGSA